MDSSLLLNWLNLTPISLVRLASIIIYLLVFIYLVKYRKNNKFSILIGFLYFILACLALTSILGSSGPYSFDFLYWPKTVGRLGNFIGRSFFDITAILFVYKYPKNYKKLKNESKIVLISLISYFIIVVLLKLNMELFPHKTNYQCVEINYTDDLGFLIHIFSVLWCPIILTRKAVFLSSNKKSNWFITYLFPGGTTSKKIKTLSFIILLRLIPLVTTYLSAVSSWYYVEIFNNLTEFVSLILSLVFFIVFINLGIIDVSFRAKIIGIVLIMVLTSLGAMGYITGDMLQKTYVDKTLIKGHQTFLFKYNSDQGYTVREEHYIFDYDFGFKHRNERMNAVKLFFSFPYFGEMINIINIGFDGYIPLGKLPERGWSFIQLAYPMIMPLWVDLNPGSGNRYYKKEKDKITITYYKVEEYSQTLPNTFQVVIHDNGDILFSFEEINLFGNYSLGGLNTVKAIGISPSFVLKPIEGINLSTDLPYSSNKGGAIIQNHLNAFSRAANDKLLIIAYLMVFFVILILFFLPKMIKTSLLKPISDLNQGIEQVEKGDLDTFVNPNFNDEIGKLTNSFNKMVKLLKKTDQLKNDFLANTSHELRTPLNGIIGISDSLLDGAAGSINKPMRDNLYLISTSGRRLTSLVNDILDFSKLKQGDLQIQQNPVNIKRLSEIVCLLSTPLLKGKNLKLVNSIPDDISNIKGDVNRIEQVLFNLIGNSIKFTHEGSIIISAYEKDGLLYTSIEDTGIGIKKENQKTIFNSFEQIEDSDTREYGGTGLGLSISKKLINLHGGEIFVDSNFGKGSKFTFSLPVTNKDEVINIKDAINYRANRVVNIQEELQEEFNSSNSTILVVDDEPINLQVLINQLRLSNFNIIQSTNGEEAINLCTRQKPDLILLDIMMPKMNGYEVSQKIREFYPPSELPIILLTAKNQEKDIITGFNSGANDYITKPFSKNELLARIKTHLELSKINIAYGCFVPHEFLDILGKESIIDVKLGDQVQKEMTIMFSDIRAFTTLSENMTPKETFDFINSYLSFVAPIIKKYNGFIDKYIGDAIMTLFPQNPKDSILAAMEIQVAVKTFNSCRLNEGKIPINIGIGLHTGPLILGTIGDKERMEETVISDSVNLASRIEGLTKLYDAQILVSEATKLMVEENLEFSFRFLGKVKVKGKDKITSVYQVIKGSLDTQEFEKGLKLYYSRDFAEASVCFNNYLKKYPNDRASKLYRERAAIYLINPPPEDWCGIEMVDTK